jgi:hypothetical protein
MLKICFYGGVKKITGSSVLIEDDYTSIIAVLSKESKLVN